MNLSTHFTLAEFEHSQTATRNEIDNSAPDAVIMPMMELCEALLEPIREHFGMVIVSSGYRCPDLNAATHGSNNSQHSKGEAADLVIPGYKPIEVCRWVEASDIPFDQLIFEGDWTHISYGSRMRRSVLTAVFEHGHKAVYLNGIQDA